MFVCNLFITALSDLMNSSLTHQHVFGNTPLAVTKLCVVFYVWHLCALTIIILLTMVDNHVLHKGSSNLHIHINKSYKTKNYTQIPITKDNKFSLIINIFVRF